MWVAVVQSSSTARCMIAGCMPSQGIFFSLFVGFADSIIARRCHHTSLLGERFAIGDDDELQQKWRERERGERVTSILDGVLEKQVIIARKTTAPPPPLAMGSKASACLFACRTRTGELLSRHQRVSERGGAHKLLLPPRRTDYVYRTRYGGRWLSFPSAVASPVTSVGRPVSSSYPIHCIRLRSVPSS
ncbi:hypothetical protein GW17_00027726 [Ensete ventricosum]|nr:hypothetical protein GW17_00027726 [Ensete ventricosum]